MGLLSLSWLKRDTSSQPQDIESNVQTEHELRFSFGMARRTRRDFWDAYVMAQSGHSLAQMADDFRVKFGKEASDLHHVVRALTWLLQQLTRTT
jgi:hypothetical protein